MMRAAARPADHQRDMIVYLSCHRMDLCSFQCFLQGQRRQYSGKAAGEHSFTGTGRANHYCIIVACYCHLHGTLYILLAFHIGEVSVIDIPLAAEEFPDVDGDRCQEAFTTE